MVMCTPVKKVYIAGPMTNYPQFNIPAFERAAKQLRAAGFEVISPVELDSEAIRSEALASKDGAMPASGKIGGETWGEILARDVRVIADTVDAIVVLPGWNKSRGARLEVFVALLCRKGVYMDAAYDVKPALDGGGALPVWLVALNRIDVIFAIARSFLS
jgi:hypothetical protein